MKTTTLAGFHTAKDNLLMRASIIKLTTGCKQVDDILEGDA